MWNQKLADRPSLNSYKAPNKNLDIKTFRNGLHYGLEHFNNDDLWNTEIALLCRIIYRMKMKFRSSKDFKLLEKLKRQLEKCYEINLGKQLKTILSMVPQKYELVTYLPTKNMLDYILVKLQGLAKVLVKSFETCLQVGAEINQRLYIGHFWMMFFILFSLVSRLSILIKFKTKFICDLYAKLLPYSHQLKNDGPNWLPKDCILPNDLKVWLEVLWVYEEECVDLTFEPTTVDFMNLIEDEDEDVMFCEEYILLDDEDKQIAKDFKKLAPMTEILNKNRMRGFSIGEDDIGEEIMEVIELSNTNNGKENLMANEELQVYSSGTEINKAELNDVLQESEQESVLFMGEGSYGQTNIKKGKSRRRPKRKRKLLKVPMDSVIIGEDENGTIDVGEELGNNEPVRKKKKKNKKQKKISPIKLKTDKKNKKKSKRFDSMKAATEHFSRDEAANVSLRSEIDNEINDLLNLPDNQTKEINPAILGVVTQANQLLEENLPPQFSKRKKTGSDKNKSFEAMGQLNNLLEQMESYVNKAAKRKARKKGESLEKTPKKSPKKVGKRKSPGKKTPLEKKSPKKKNMG